MTSTAKLNTLHSRMAEHQRTLIMHAAEIGLLPSASALDQIAQLEGALGAVDAVIEEQENIVRMHRVASTETAPSALPRSAEEKTRKTGTVKWFNATKGYGFIEPEDGSPDAFVHISAVEAAGMSELYDGQKIAYELKTDQRTGKSSADQLKAVE